MTNMSCNRIRFAAFGIIGLFLGVSALMAVPIGNSTGGEFKLSNTTHSVLTVGVGSVYTMYNDGTAPSGSKTVNDDYVYWAANAAAGSQISFAGTTFTVKLNVGIGGWPAGIHVYVADMSPLDANWMDNEAGSVLDITLNDGGVSPDATAGDGIYSGSGTVRTSGQNYVRSGSYLALRLWGDGIDSYTMATDGTSTFSWSGSPDYPVPELSTILLMGSGLVVGVGLLAYSNRKKK